MTAALLFAAFLILAGLALISAGVGRESIRRDAKRLRAENVRLRRTLRLIESEARTQLAAGNLTFEYIHALINDHREKELA